jgi:molybdenum cofactor guanylyltransferase
MAYQELGLCRTGNSTRAPVYHRGMERAPAEMSAFILAGGRSTRMGMDKAFVALDGRTLLARMLDLARSVTPEVAIVGDAAKFAPFAPTVEDLFPGCGPLGGIHAALRASKTDLNLILAVDVPFVSLALLQYLITRAVNAPGATVTLARNGEGWQPLCAIYRRAFQNAAERALHEGRYKIDALFAEVPTHVIEEEELETAGFAPRIFRNLNTPEDLAEAEK